MSNNQNLTIDGINNDGINTEERECARDENGCYFTNSSNTEQRSKVGKTAVCNDKTAANDKINPSAKTASVAKKIQPVMTASEVNKSPSIAPSSEEKKKAAAKRAAADYRRKYFDYYDDVKTSIKEDW